MKNLIALFTLGMTLTLGGWGGCNLPTAPKVVNPPLINEPIIKDCDFEPIMETEIQPECGSDNYIRLPRYTFKEDYEYDLFFGSTIIKDRYLNRLVSVDTNASVGYGARYRYFSEDNGERFTITAAGVDFYCYPIRPLTPEELKSLERKDIIIYGRITAVTPIVDGRPIHHIVIEDCVFYIKS